MKIAVIDAKGAGLGQSIIKRIKRELGSDIYIVALGTNLQATTNMLKSGADEGISGEKRICAFCRMTEVDGIIGPIGAICSGAIDGEITPYIADTVFNMDCIKYLIPLQEHMREHGIYIPQISELKIKEMIQDIIVDITSKAELNTA